MPFFLELQTLANRRSSSTNAVSFYRRASRNAFPRILDGHSQRPKPGAARSILHQWPRQLLFRFAIQSLVCSRIAVYYADSDSRGKNDCSPKNQRMAGGQLVKPAADYRQTIDTTHRRALIFPPVRSSHVRAVDFRRLTVHHDPVMQPTRS